MSCSGVCGSSLSVASAVSLVRVECESTSFGMWAGLCDAALFEGLVAAIGGGAILIVSLSVVLCLPERF